MIHLISLFIFVNNLLVYQCLPYLPYEHAIRSSALQNHALQKGSTVFDQASKKGVNSEQVASGFAEDGGKKFEDAQAEGHFDNENAFKKAHEQSGHFADENFHKLQGGSLADVGKKKSHKKGHHKSGYHNSYHKDESGGNSSFYDDSNDEGDEQYFRSNKGIFGDAAQRGQHGSHLDNKLSSNDAEQHGGYKKGNNYGAQHADNRKYNQGQYYNDQNKHAVSNLGNQYGEHGLTQEELYKSQTPVGIGGGYYPAPVVAKPIPVPVPVADHIGSPRVKPPVYPQSKITVYEDPRYVYDQGAYYDDRIDYRPAQYYGKQPSYDYYYY